LNLKIELLGGGQCIIGFLYHQICVMQIKTNMLIVSDSSAIMFSIGLVLANHVIILDNAGNVL